MSERAIVRRILARLRARPNCWVVKIHGGPYSRIGEPDLHGVDRGRAFVLEVKQPGGRATEAQHRELARWRSAGAIAEVVTSPEEAEAVLREDARVCCWHSEIGEAAPPRCSRCDRAMELPEGEPAEVEAAIAALDDGRPPARSRGPRQLREGQRQ